MTHFERAVARKIVEVKMQLVRGQIAPAKGRAQLRALAEMARAGK